MSLDELWQLFPIELREHNPQYTEWYFEEERALLDTLESFGVCRINHIGSTAVAGLVAKPIIDILLELPPDYSTEQAARILEDNGWLVMTANEAEQTLDLNKGYTPDGFADKVFHLHIKPEGDWDELYFRDYLREHASVAEDYAQLKLNLLQQFKHDRDAYTHAKSSFVVTHTQQARKEFPGRYTPKKKDTTTP